MSAPPDLPFAADPEQVRRRLRALIAAARGAAVMPWSDRQARKLQTVFARMAERLDAEEAAELRLELTLEIERLRAL